VGVLERLEALGKTLLHEVIDLDIHVYSLTVVLGGDFAGLVLLPERGVFLQQYCHGLFQHVKELLDQAGTALVCVFFTVIVFLLWQQSLPRRGVAITPRNWQVQWRVAISQRF